MKNTQEPQVGDTFLSDPANFTVIKIVDKTLIARSEAGSILIIPPSVWGRWKDLTQNE